MKTEQAISLIKPIGMAMNLGEMVTDYLAKNQILTIKHILIGGFSEENVIEIYRNDFDKLSQISILYPSAVIKTMTSEPVEVIVAEGKNAKHLLRETIGSVQDPADTIRWNFVQRIRNDKELTNKIIQQTGLPLDRAVLIANGIHGTRDLAELSVMQKLIANL